MIILAAPLQGYTEGIWRLAHAGVFEPYSGTPDAYCAPFLRVEKGDVRARDLRDLSLSATGPVATVPQIIFRDIEEFRLLADTLIQNGYGRIDLNLGCPFPPQCHRGRGTAMVARTDILEAVAEEIHHRPGIRFSIKMRLGLSSPHEWENSVPIINRMPLTHVTVHPRTATQQYKGTLHTAEFARMLQAITHPVIYNGDIAQPADIDRIMETYPSLAGVMIGRGLLARPSLIAEWRSGKEWDTAMQTEALTAMHGMIYRHYESVLCGEAQMLSKLIPFWEYPSAIIGRRKAREIAKSRNLSVYMSRVREAVSG